MKVTFEKLKGIRLPREIEFSPNGDILTIRMNEKGVNENMQEDEAAFEAWALVARAKEYKKIQLDISALPDGEKVGIYTLPEHLHLNRFIYRALKFSENFDWFTLSPKLEKKVEQFRKALERETLVYNVPTQEAKETAENSEAKMERRLISNVNETNKLLDANVEMYYSQLPVGLFRGKKSKSTMVFPGGSAAIDLWGIENDTFHLVELKVGKNKGLGVLSELFFYVSFMFDVHCNKMAKAAENTTSRGFDELANANIKTIKGYILLEEEHSQLEEAFIGLKECKNQSMCFEKIINYQGEKF